MTDYAWSSKLLRDVAFTRRARQLWCWFKRWLISGNSAIWTVLVLEQSITVTFLSSSRDKNSGFCSKTQWQMFLLVSGRHVGAHLGGHQHGGSIQISIKLGKTFLRISSIRKITVIWILARLLAYLRSFYFQTLDLICWTVLIFLIWSILNGVTLKTSNSKRRGTAVPN